MLDDFGQQGEPPVNPELLDWLACELMDSGWDVKHIVRLIVNSRTYKQVSTASRELQTRDPLIASWPQAVGASKPIGAGQCA